MLFDLLELMMKEWSNLLIDLPDREIYVHYIKNTCKACVHWFVAVVMLWAELEIWRQENFVSLFLV